MSASESTVPLEPFVSERTRAEREALVVQWTPLAHKIAYRYLRRLGRWYELEDLVSIAKTQLWVASATFDPSKGAAFGTFAYYAVFRKFEVMLEYFFKSKRRDGLRSVSLDETNDFDQPVWQIPSATPAPDAALDQGPERDVLQRALGSLMPRERLIIQGRFVEERTLEHLAQELGVTRERVRQLEKRGLVKLRQFFVTHKPDQQISAAPVSCYLASPNLDSREFRVRSRRSRAPAGGMPRKVALCPDST